MEGTVRFIGSTHFTFGPVVGVEMDGNGRGNHSGEVDRIRYFDAKRNGALFVRIEEIEDILDKSKRKKIRMSSMDRESAERWKAALRAMAAEEAADDEEVDLTALKQKERRRLERFHLEIGDVVELDKGRRGILHFVGRVDAVNGGKELVFGVELMDRAMGKHDGSLHGVRYFECAPKRGCFLKSNQIRKRVVFETQSIW